MAQGFKQLVGALQHRYDYHSARAVVAEALDAAGLEKKSSYEDKEWSKLLKALLAVGDELDAVWQSLGEAPKGVKLTSAPAPAPTPAAPDGAAAESPVEEETPKEAAPKKKAPKKKASKKK